MKVNYLKLTFNISLILQNSNLVKVVLLFKKKTKKYEKERQKYFDGKIEWGITLVENHCRAERVGEKQGITKVKIRLRCVARDYLNMQSNRFSLSLSRENTHLVPALLLVCFEIILNGRRNLMCPNIDTFSFLLRLRGNVKITYAYLLFFNISYLTWECFSVITALFWD